MVWLNPAEDINGDTAVNTLIVPAQMAQRVPLVPMVLTARQVQRG